MNTLIVYMSKHGTTEKTVSLLVEKLKDKNIKVINLRKDKVKNVDNYDNIIIGGSIHAGTIQSRIKKFIDNNIESLNNKRIGLFMCCMEREERQDEQFRAAYPDSLRKNACCKAYFGGEFNFNRMNFFEKAIIKKIAGIEESITDIDIEEINKFAITWNEMQNN